MDIKNIFKRIPSRKVNSYISVKLYNEISKTQELLEAKYKKTCEKRKKLNRCQASDFLAETYRIQRYKLQNGR